MVGTPSAEAGGASVSCPIQLPLVTASTPRFVTP